MPAIALTSGKQGINRYRIKGGANPETLFDAVNCYITLSGGARPRPGTVIDAVLPAGTKGLMSYRGRLHVFADQAVTVPDGYGVSILTHPSGASLERIHFAEPFLGYPYVVAEWSDGAILHYWLDGEGADAGLWKPNHVYPLQAVVQPHVANGHRYRAHRQGPPGPLWKPGVEVQVGMVVEPSVANGYVYEAIEVHGLPPRTGEAEPAWPTERNAVVVEEADVGLPGGGSGGGQVTPPPVVPPRYDNPGGSQPPRTTYPTPPRDDTSMQEQ